jgi:hypothetical protein
MKINFLYLAGFILCLLSCSAIQADPVTNPAEQLMKTKNINIQIPIELRIFETGDQDQLIADNDSNQNDLDRPGEYRISIFDNQASKCSPSLTGASSLTSLSSAAWGRVDAFDRGIEGGEGSPNSLCRPFFPYDLEERFRAAPPCIQDQKGEFKTDCINQLRKYEIKQGLYSAYAMCSEKDGKTVVICISQMKDDPEMAKDIFETFRWTE